jgi:hypothetical protein
MAGSQCDLSNAIHLQSATYTHSIIVRVQPILSREFNSNEPASHLLRQVLVREVIKYPITARYQRQIQMNDHVIIRINENQHEDDVNDHSCWHLLRISTVDIILFLNETTSDEFDLYYPPVESTFRVRQNIDAVLNYGKY